VPAWRRRRRPDAARRLALFVDAYGLDEPGRRRLLQLLAARTRAMAGFLTASAAAGTQPWAGLHVAGHTAAWAADAAYIDRHHSSWSTALLR
jgi:hypothetical protein